MSDVQDLEMNQEELDHEIATLKQQLDLLGVKYHHKANANTLSNLLAEHMKQEQPSRISSKVALDIAEMRKKAFEMIPCSIHCNDPSMKGQKGDFITCGNSVLGHHTFVVPFNCSAAENYELPRIAIDALRTRKYLASTSDEVRDVSAKAFYMSPKYTIVELR